jgi:pSer/pThr/pTyr-binding forkhead associated (FHA) protein
MSGQDEDAKPVDIGIEDMESGGFLMPPSSAPTAVRLTTVGLEETDYRGEKRLHRIVTPEFRVGRHPECNLVLHQDGKVSRRHARIRRLEDDCVIEDNESINGTFVNGQRIDQPTSLQAGDKISIGSRAFTYVKCMDANLPPGL